jgi:predicted AlkP superfamily phosphohydrolase/phosphomutase
MTRDASPRRVLVIGLDCATPQFVFGPERFDLPNLRRLRERGCWGPLRSCDPPITVPAWSVMTSGKDPGTLGVYGFRNRKDRSYDAMSTANSTSIRERRVWDILSREGRKVVVLGVPQTYPVTPVNGWMAADFLTPDASVNYAYPKLLKAELEQALGECLFDVDDFRTDRKDDLLKRLYALMNNRFDAAEFLMDSKPWDFFMMVEMGVDRLHHGFWKHCDPSHPKYSPSNPYEDVIRDYYQAVDARIGRLLKKAGRNTAVLVVSDHGAKAMRGGIRVNQWLMREGFLRVNDALGAPKRIEDCAIDWSGTRAWASGGYYGRIFINVAGREPQGVVPKSEYETFRSMLIAHIEAMTDKDGHPMGNHAMRPEDLYEKVTGIAPDLLVYFGDLDWRAIGTIGFDDIFADDNDTGPDDANHDFHGIFIMDDGAERGGGEILDASLLDIAPTILDLMNVAVPGDMRGRIL